VFGRSHRICNDGVTIAAVIEPKNEFEQLATEVIKDAANRTNEQAGDATSCTIVLAGSLIKSIFSELSESSSHVGAGVKKTGSVMKIRKELLAAGKEVEEKVRQAAKEVKTLEDLKKIAIVSTENEEIGTIIAEMWWKAGKNGNILVNEGFGGKIETEIGAGARFPAKVPSKGFVNNPARMEMVAKDVSVLLTNYELKNPAQLGAAINPILKTHNRLAILAPEFSQEVLADLWKANFRLLGGGAIEKTNLEIYPIKTPSLRTVQWEDLEVYFGAKFIDKKKDQKLLGIDESVLGFAESIIVHDSETRDDATALGGKGARKGGAILDMQLSSAVQDRIETLRKAIEVTREEQDKNLLRQRIASLGSAVGVIKVSADSSSETYYLKKKIEDGVYACRAALEEGYVKGGGLCLKEI
ncbi:MAG: TCP-1/cpn60 chaperonin family protein, partial [Patescibacteria group bacterium]